MFKDSQEGQTHSYNDGCGELEHNAVPHTDKIEEILADAENSDWMKYIEAAQCVAFIHGAAEYTGETIQDWLRRALLSYGEAVRGEAIEEILEDAIANERSRIQEIVADIASGAPEGDWYLLPPGSQKVVGYISDPTIGEIAYKGKAMNIRAVIEETISTAISHAVAPLPSQETK